MILQNVIYTRAFATHRHCNQQPVEPRWRNNQPNLRTNTIKKLIIMPPTNTSSTLFKKTALVSALTIAGLSSSNLYAASYAVLSFDRGDPIWSGNNAVIAEPRTGETQILTVRPTLSFAQDDFDAGAEAQTLANWPNSVCTLNGRVALIPWGGEQPTEGSDYRLANESFSFTITPYLNEGGRVQFDTLSTALDIEILADNDTEEEESFDVRIRDLAIACANEGGDAPIEGNSSVTPTIKYEGEDEFGYGMYVTIIDTLNPESENSDGETPLEEVEGTADSRALTAIPAHQKSLASQFNTIRVLSLQTASTRTKSLKREMINARKNRGFNNNLQVRVDGFALPQPSGLSAGDGIDNFGRWGFFVNGSVDIGTRDESSNLKIDYDSTLLMAGVDYQVANNFILGSALSYTHLDAGSKAVAETDSTQGNLSLFASFFVADAFYLDAIVNVGSSQLELERSITDESNTLSSTEAATHGKESSFAFGTGYNFSKGAANLRVFSSANYIDVHVEGYNELIAGDAESANVGDINLQSLTADFGFEFSWAISTGSGVYTPQFSLAYEHQYADDAVDISGQFIDLSGNSQAFNYHGAELDNEYLNSQIGVNGVFKNGLTGYFVYDTYIGRDDLSSNTYSLGARWQF